MPRGHGKTIFSTDKVVDKRSWALSRRFSEQSSRRFPSMESQMVVPVLRNCEESRRIVLTFLTLDDHMWRLLVPFTSFIQGPELKNQQGSQDPVNALDSLNSSNPQPSIFIQFDLKEQSLSSQENPAFSSASVKTVTDYRPPASNVLGKSHRLRRNKFIKNTLSNSLGAAAAEESSRLCYGSDCIASSASVDVTSEVNKHAKPSSRNKGKKKRKQYKRSIHKKTSTQLENQNGVVKCDASESEMSASDDPICLDASGTSLSLIAGHPCLPVQDSSVEVMEQLNNESNGKDCSDSISNSAGKQLDKGINDFRKPPSLPYKFTENTNKVPIGGVTSISNLPYEMSITTSLQNNSELGMTEDSLNDFGTRCSSTNDGEFDPLKNRMILNSRNPSVQGENKELSHQDDYLSSSCSVSSHWQKNVINTDCSTERFLDSSQASSSDDFHPVRAKRGRLARKLSSNSNGMHRLNSSHLHRCSENDNKHSIWQKVEKSRTSESTYPKSKDKIASRNVDISVNCMETKVKSEQLTELKQSKNVKSFRSTCTYLEKLHRKPNLDAAETQSACHTSISSNDVPPKIQVIRKEKFGTAVEFTKSSQLTDSTNSSLGKTKTSHSNILQQATMVDNICSTLHVTSSLSREIPPNSSVVKITSDHSYADKQFHTNVLPSVDMSKDPFICTKKESIQHMIIETESAHLDSFRTNNSFGTQLQKSLPTMRHDLVTTRSQIVNREDSIVYEPVTSNLISCFADKILTSNSHGLDSLSTRETQCLSLTSGYMDCSSYEDDELTRKLDSQPCTSSRESHDLPSPSGCHFSHEMGNQHFSCFETDFTKITDAADGSYKLLVAAEGIQQATGSPLAEFEKVLRSASPLIETGYINMCSTCSQNQIIGDSFSSYQVPNISLKNLWQWYEKPGSYGLEVKVDDLYNSNRSQAGLSKICAYFVPFLSAVQLFARSGCPISHPKNDAEGDLMKTCEACKTCRSLSSLASLPIFSKLLPRPHKKVDTPSAKLFSSCKSEDFNKSFFSEQLADELLFEYFDSDQPQQRRHLFDKIQELIRGDSLSNCHFFGDPSKLGCLNMKELHPASWYAVAWYPIYRIPDGNFRAAFLTYHSFGHFVSRSTSSISEGRVNSVILPVVGLQSYNAKGECWFVPKKLKFRAAQTDASSSKDHSEILKGRLQSLERTACAMSRAAIRKGNLECTNKHPDYEFFLSRSR